MRNFRVIRTVALLASSACMCITVAMAGDQCLVCHEALGGKVPSLYKNDVHRQKGITCAGCHGGDATSDDMDKAMDKKGGFAGVPKGDAISQACARCHSDAERMKAFGSSLPLRQWENLQASVHGNLSGVGAEHTVQCITCHDAHGIVRVSNPSSPVYPLNVVRKCTGCHANAGFMRTYNPSLAVDQLEKYRTSVHGMRNAGGDPKVAECASCHGSHSILRPGDVKSRVYPENIPATCAGCHGNVAYMAEYKIPTDQFDKYAKSVHGVALLQKHDAGAPACNSCHGNHGAAPPGVESISNVCGTCHALNAELFAGSPHKKAFAEQKLPACETCHGNHEISPASKDLLGVSPDAVCARCHALDKNEKGYALAQVMRRMVDSLETMEAESKGLVDEAEQKGMEIGEAKFKLRDVRQARLETRTIVHSFDESKFRPVVGKGLTIAVSVSDEARGVIHEFFFRRLGLGVSTLIITTVGICLLVIIRRIDRKQKKNAET